MNFCHVIFQQESSVFAIAVFASFFAGATTSFGADVPPDAIKINEVMASNGETLATKNGGAELDWVELRNDYDVDIDVTGWYMYDDATKPNKWVRIEGSCVVPAHGFKIVWCDKNYTNWAAGEAHAKFGVGKSDSTVVLASSNSVDAIVATMVLPPQMKDVSYGRGSREKTILGKLDSAQWRVSDGEWQTASGPVGMPGAATGGFTVTSYLLDKNACANIPAVEGALASGKYNPTRTLADVQTIAYRNSSATGSAEFDSAYHSVTELGIPDDGTNYAVLVEGVVSIPRAGSWTFSVGSDDGFQLVAWNEKYHFQAEYTGARNYGQTPAIFRIQEPGAYNVRLLYFQGSDDATLDFSVMEGEFEDYESFTLDGFHLVGTAESGVTHAGAWAGHVSTDVSESMLNITNVLEWKSSFTIDAALAADDVCRLKVRYADGFEARVNGASVANAPASEARRLADALTPVVILIPTELLVAGDNRLEITAINDDARDAYFLLSAEITVTKAAEELVFFREPTPGTENTTAGYGPASPKVQFSVPHGYKTEAFDLTLSCADDPSATIYYTLDGTSPTTSSTPFTSPIHVSETTCIRAAVPQEGSVIQQDAAATYLFLDDILSQTRDVVPAGFPSAEINSQVMRYGMNQSIVNGADRDRVLRGFTNSVSTISIVIDPHNLFDPIEGIYVNAKACDGREWERATMVEQIDPTNADNGFSTATGIRIRGATSRNPEYPKHSLRLFFRNDYGDGPLEFPLFGDEGAGKFKKVDLRTSQNYAWANGTTYNYKRDTFVHEVFARDTQRDMGELYTRSRYYNLFINGHYWGLYQTQERGDEDFAETYNGGDADLYDVIKTSQPGYVTGASEGTIDAWKTLWNMAVNEGFAGVYSNNYHKAMGLNPDGTRNPEYPIYLNPTNLMDFIINFHYMVDYDSPAAANKANNLYAVRDRDDNDEGLKSQGFYFLRHDAEHAMGRHSNSEYKDDPTLYGTELKDNNFRKLKAFNPAELHYKLCDNPEYKMAFADRFYKHCLAQGGALTVEKARVRFESRMAEIDDVIVCEAARWATGGQTRDTWLAACSECLTFIKSRMPYMLSQYRNRGWYPSVAAPAAYDSNGNLIAAGMLLPDGATVRLMDSEGSTNFISGTVYYTLDGSDPRTKDGSVSSSAMICPEIGFELPQGGATVNARYISEDGEWSALSVSALAAETLSDQLQGIRVAAVYSNTLDGGGDGSEFIILTNLLDHAISLEGLRITCAKTGDAPKVDVTLGAVREIPAGGTLKLTKATDWPTMKITNGAVDMLMYDSDGATIQTLHVDAGWWPVGYNSKGKPIGACDGTGAHFIALDFNDTVTTEEQWRPSFMPPASTSAGYEAIKAVAADDRIRRWLDGLATTAQGIESVTNFAGTAEALTACYLVNAPLETEPEIELSIQSITFDDDGNVVVGGELTLHGTDSGTRTINGEFRLYHAATLEELNGAGDGPTIKSMGNAYPIPVGVRTVEKVGGSHFYWLKIE